MTRKSIAVRMIPAVACSILLISSSAQGEQSSDVIDRARQLFVDGVALAEQGNLDAALELFEEALGLYPHRSLIYNIAWVLSRSGRDVDAIENFEEYLSQSEGDDPERISRAEAELARLREVLSVNEAPRSPREETTSPRQVQEVTSELSSDDDFIEQEFETAHVDPMANRSTRRRLRPPWFWATIGLVATTAVTMAITGGLAVGRYEDWRTECSVQARESGEQLVWLTDGLLIAISIEAVVALVLGLFTDFRGPSRSLEAENPQ